MDMKLKGLFVGLGITLSGSMVQASLLIQGNFTASEFNSGTVSTLSGSFEAIFDDSVVTGTGTGIEAFHDLQILTSFTLDPNPLGSTIFNTSNVGLDLHFLNGGFYGAFLGGLPNVSAQSGDQDDLFVSYRNGQVSWLAYTIAAETGIPMAGTTSGRISASAVPESTTLTLMGLGLAGIGYRRKRKKNRRPSTPPRLGGVFHAQNSSRLGRQRSIHTASSVGFRILFTDPC